jgi:hypothetical protein
MEFWKPSVRKLATAAILVVMSFINSCSSAAINEFYKNKLFEPWKQVLEKHQGLLPKTPTLSGETEQALLELTKSAEYRRLVWMGRLKLATQAAIGIFLAYFAACLIHRKKKPKSLTHAPTDDAADTPTPAP